MKQILLLLLYFISLNVFSYTAEVAAQIEVYRGICLQTAVLNGSPHFSSSYYPSGYETYTCVYNIAQGGCPPSASVASPDSPINTCSVPYFKINRTTGIITDFLNLPVDTITPPVYSTSFNSISDASSACVNFKTSNNIFSNAQFATVDGVHSCSYVELTQSPCESPFVKNDSTGYCSVDVTISNGNDGNGNDGSGGGNGGSGNGGTDNSALTGALNSNSTAARNNTLELKLNTEKIVFNTSALKETQVKIESNTSGLQSNTTSINSLSGVISNLDVNYNALNTVLGLNTTSLGINNTNISANTTSLNSNSSNLNANTTSLNANTSSLNTNNVNISSNTTSLKANTGALNTNTTSLDTLTSALNDDDSDGTIKSKLTNSFSSLKDSLIGSTYTFTNSGATCPTWTFDENAMLVGGLTLDAHCSLAEIIRPIISPLMLTFFTIIGFRTVFSA